MSYKKLHFKLKFSQQKYNKMFVLSEKATIFALAFRKYKTSQTNTLFGRF